MAAGWPTKANYATGDVLSATNMNDLSGTVNIIAPTAKGDLYAGSAANTYTKLAVGANDTVLTADSTAATGLKWAAAASGGGMTLLSTTSTTTGSSYTISSISSAYNHLQIIWQGLSCTSAAAITLAFAGNTGATGGVTSDATFTTTLGANAKLMPDTQAYGNTIMCNIFNYTAAATKNIQIAYGGVATGYRGGGYQGFIEYSSAISTFTVAISSGSFSAGSLKLYGVK